MIIIKRLIVENFKCFSNLDLEFNEDINIFIGDNGTGKSTILQALDIVFSGSKKKVLDYGLENLFNKRAVNEGLRMKAYDALPQMSIFAFFEEDTKSPKYERFRGEKNPEHVEEYGIKFVCLPDEDYMEEIEKCLREDPPIFPYKLYKISFRTFKDEPYNSYIKPVGTKYIDSIGLRTFNVIKNLTKDTYVTTLDERTRTAVEQKFSERLTTFELPAPVKEKGIYLSGNLEDFLDIKEGEIPLLNSGDGKIAAIKLKYTLDQTGEDAPIILLEEPENRLSCFRLKKLVSELTASMYKRQFFVATHSSKIVSGLGLRKAFFIGDNTKCNPLKDISKDTSIFFEKATSDNLLQFVLSRKVVLVEGAAEYILMGLFYKKVRNTTPEEENVCIIPLNSLSFRRYLEVAGVLKNKVAVVRDNDRKKGPFYPEYSCDLIRVFSEEDTSLYTFEKALYAVNKELCDRIFSGPDAEKYMLCNKAESAYKMLCYLLKNKERFNIPNYIEKAILWIGK